MIEEVKMIMDEQTRRTVDSLRSSLEEVFAPLKKLEGMDSRLSEIGGGDKIVSAVRRSIEDVQDSIDDLSGKVAAFVSMQETIIAAIDEIKATLGSLRKPINGETEQSGKKRHGDVKNVLPERSMANDTKKTPVTKSTGKKSIAPKRKINASKNNKKTANEKRKGGR